MSSAVWLVARRELTERVRERSFLIATGVSFFIVLLIIVLPDVLGAGEERHALGVTDARALPVAQAAAAAAQRFDAEVEVRRLPPSAAGAALAAGEVDAVLSAREVRFQEEPDDDLVAYVQGARQELALRDAVERAGADPRDAAPLAVSTVEPVDEDRDARGGFAFVAVILLYGQLISYGFLVASGVVEEKSSRVIEVLLSTLRPRTLLAGKVIGLGLLGLGQLLFLAAVGLALATATGALDVDGDVLVAAALALAWFLVGYAFYACAFACAGAIVPRQEELQSSTTPLTLILLVSFFLSFSALNDPDGTLATVTAYLPTTAPMVMPVLIALGEASVLEVLGAFAVTVAAIALLVPLAGRIYANAVLRTGRAVKLREALRPARAQA